MKGLEEIHNIKTMVNKTALYSFAKREDFIKACNVVENELKERKHIRVYKVAKGINVFILEIEGKMMPIEQDLYERLKEVLKNE